MQIIIEPNCDMLWEIYLDWLQDQGNEDLRYVYPSCLTTGCIINRIDDFSNGLGDDNSSNYQLFENYQQTGSGCNSVNSNFYLDGNNFGLGYGISALNRFNGTEDGIGVGAAFNTEATYLGTGWDIF